MHFASSLISFKALDAQSGHIAGILAGFGNVDRVGDRLVKGCFTKSLAERGTPLPMLLHHDNHRPIGAWQKWEERSEGLFVEGSIVLATADGREAYELAKAGALSGLSIGFIDKRATTDQKTGVRTVTEVDLVEGSLVAVPANPKAEVHSVKQIASPRDIADLLREGGGMSRDRAKIAAGAAWKAITSENEADDPELVALVGAAIARIKGAH